MNATFDQCSSNNSNILNKSLNAIRSLINFKIAANSAINTTINNDEPGKSSDGSPVRVKQMKIYFRLMKIIVLIYYHRGLLEIIIL